MKQTLPKPCEHGRLKSQCNECALQKENDELRAYANRLENALVICDAQHNGSYIGCGLVQEVLEEPIHKSLADIKAEAVNAEFIALLKNLDSLIKSADSDKENGLLLSLSFMKKMVSEYANKLKEAKS